MTMLRPIGPELERSNLRILAQRQGTWPAGAVHECERLGRIYREWHVSWMGACDWNRRPAGFYAWRRSQMIRVYGKTAQKLERAIEAAPPPWELKLSRLMD
jgi:hypothetical protein